MDKNIELTKISNDDLLKIYKDMEDYIAFLDKEKKEKGTEEKW